MDRVVKGRQQLLLLLLLHPPEALLHEVTEEEVDQSVMQQVKLVLRSMQTRTRTSKSQGNMKNEIEKSCRQENETHTVLLHIILRVAFLRPQDLLMAA